VGIISSFRPVSRVVDKEVVTLIFSSCCKDLLIMLDSNCRRCGEVIVMVLCGV